MNISRRQLLVDYYTPLLREFLSEVQKLDHPLIDRMPEPFLPVFGSRYEQSAVRLIVLGQDTRGWGDLRGFIADGRTPTGGRLQDHFDEFESREFRMWGPTRYHFWGFVMMFLAALHGQENWGMMKHGEMSEILDSFAWGNCNAIEFYQSTVAGLCSANGNTVPLNYWENIRQAGARFDRFSHVLETVSPHAAVILWKGMKPQIYFEGLKYETVSTEDGITHYRIHPHEVDVFHSPHPNNMRFIKGANHFCAKLKELFVRHNLTTLFPRFLAGQKEGRAVLDHILKQAPNQRSSMDKFQFVAWVADELKKRCTFMSVPTLCELLNSKGYTTNYGTGFTGGRGSYRLVSGTYHRLMAASEPDRAANVAVAFRRPNFQYAYNIED